MDATRLLQAGHVIEDCTFAKNQAFSSRTACRAILALDSRSSQGFTREPQIFNILQHRKVYPKVYQLILISLSTSLDQLFCIEVLAGSGRLTASFKSL